jgi:lipopolysaccharide transport system permease protein
MQVPSVSPRSILVSVWGHRNLILQMTRREVVGRYRGSIMGLAWSFFNPVLMLLVYTFVFGTVFKSRWGGSTEESQISFAIVLFVGMTVHGLFAECVNRAPALILANVNYVKKVVFPLEILPIVSFGAAFFHTTVNLVVLMAAISLTGHVFHGTVLLAPLVLFPLALMTLGVAWILASLGVFIRDVGPTIGIITTVMMFLSPVFYPIDSLPEAYRPWIMANPLTFIIEQSRAVLIWGNFPDWHGLAVYSSIAALGAWLGYAWFQKTRKGFADVL